ncbi:MAG: hypothetical protein IT349_10855 [Candidatus Eisenbacteria bacterium]|nr:hypothetical protein [Candidatus Eisenbacteria bacterium]
MKRVPLAMLAGALAIAPGQAFAIDPILTWTDHCSALTRTLNQTRGCPCPIARGVAMMYLAQFDAVNSIANVYEPYLIDYPAPAGASMEAAAIVAAHDVLLSIYPIRQGMLDSAMNADLAQVPDGQAKLDGIEVGHAVAANMIAARANDGSNFDPTYVGENTPGHWRPTYPDFRTGCHAAWGDVTPFGLASGDQFAPPPPPALDSPEYFEHWNEVRLYGSNQGDPQSTLQREIAFFWANDQDGTSKPPGQLCQLTKIVSQMQGLTLVENARLFGLLGICLGDAGIACWSSKYDTDLDFWRPVTAIREADTDGNPQTQPDLDWTPLSFFTPNFPGYTSGHSTFGGSNSQLMRRFFGFDEITFDLQTEDPHLDAGWTRTIHSFTQAEEENRDSRIWLGVHFRFDCEQGVELGHHIADWAYDNYLRPIEPLTSSVIGRRNPVQLLTIAPNPTQGAAKFRFALQAPGTLGVGIYDASGREVSLLSKSATIGSNWIEWDGQTADHRPVSPGVYFVRGSLNGQPVDPKSGGRFTVLR